MEPSEQDLITTHAEERVGRVLRGKWRLEQLLGVGGMAAVYAATHRNGKRVAVKILHAELCVRRDLKDRFLREGYAANSVGHAGAVSILDDDTEEDGTVFLVMDLLEGETLDQRFRRCGRLDPQEALAVAHQLLGVLAAAHGKGIVHRDIKPENVMLTRDREIKILDFGIAKVREQVASVTRSSSSFGTPAYMPPEQARGRWEQVDGRSDLWAVGATMFSVLTGRTVHEAGTPNEHLLEAMTTPAPPLASVKPDLPAAVAAIVDRALAFERDQRWADARAMQEAIRGAYESLYRGPIELGVPAGLARNVAHPEKASDPGTDDEEMPPETVTKVRRPLGSTPDEGYKTAVSNVSGPAIELPARTEGGAPAPRSAGSSSAPAAQARRPSPMAVGIGIMIAVAVAYFAVSAVNQAAPRPAQAPPSATPVIMGDAPLPPETSGAALPGVASSAPTLAAPPSVSPAIDPSASRGPRAGDDGSASARPPAPPQSRPRPPNAPATPSASAPNAPNAPSAPSATANPLNRRL